MNAERAALVAAPYVVRLISLIDGFIRAGHSDEEAAAAALEQMRTTPVPAPISAEIKAKFEAAKQPREG